MGDVLVVGGGLIGLAIAFELAERGAAVRVYDRGEPGHGASWAGAGMLAPFAERIEDEPMLALCRDSLARYPAFVERVSRAGGVSVEVALDGIVEAAFDDARLDALAAYARELPARGIACELLDRRATLIAEPSLGKHVTGALVVRGQGYVDNRRLGRALLEACRARGVVVHAPVRDVALECDGRRALGIRSELGFTPARTVINAAGAWAAFVPGLPDFARPPVTPVKGQMLALAAPQGFLRRATWVPGAYLVPRPDGRLLIGATVEPEAGFDERVTAAATHALLHAALAAAPALGAFTVTETWAGLRPATPDGRPLIGPTAIDGLILATGHYRNGILLAPVTAELVASFVETGDIAPLREILPA
ncbi:MAG TPA: glycine oxidase ThiO [Candidatus Acidoferrales bacterium]|nr:glycine oxidase ThiO [Candidatus Acidoferrales bacterium]